MAPTKVAKNILGYELKYRLGSGAYGEVWAADAPGGISKAVKLIYGYHDEKRALNELKALNRIKQVRHPFLLSLERIEVVDGQLVVIAELADKSLKDRYDECREAGEPGIPRKELLGYMSDAADALDFISESHSLQHLDVKPENLLVLGGHVKVADFGLVKDVHDASLSMMAGLTPAYASPEMFDGRPGACSDQYSLAIVFHEMLTGVRPFAGTTAAQLAAQHMKGRPNLLDLPRADQSVIAKALAKDPKSRFANCRELVQELANPRKRHTPSKRRRFNSPVHGKPEADTNTKEQTIIMSGSGARIARAPVAAKPMPAIACSTEDATFRPTLLIGIGQSATTILRKYRRRLSERLGATEGLPAIELVAVDTDRKSLDNATRSETKDCLAFDQVLSLPLRKPEQYRNDATSHNEWLSRRWIYNIPRSLQTEGIRPLGRLAFVDNCDELFNKIHQSLASICDDEAIAKTAATLQIERTDAEPQVFILTSISGGVGSGMVVDVGYAVRTIMSEMKLSDDRVIAVLTHSASPQSTSLAVANSYACLTELHHYYNYGYTSDHICGLPSFDAGRPAFSHTYVVPLGDRLSKTQIEQATDNVAEFIYLNTSSRCASFFEACRQRDIDESSDLHVRTLGLSHTGLAGDEWSAIPARVLATQLLDRWCNCEFKGEKSFDPTAFADQRLADVQLTIDGLRSHVKTGIQERLGEDPVENLTHQVMELQRGDRGTSPSVVATINEFCDLVDCVLLDGQQHDAASELSDNLHLNRTVMDHLSPLTESMQKHLLGTLETLIDQPRIRIAGAIAVHGICVERLRSFAETIETAYQDKIERRLEFRESLCGGQLPEVRTAQCAEDCESYLHGYARLALEERELEWVAAVLRTMEAHLVARHDDLFASRREIELVRERIGFDMDYEDIVNPDARDIPSIIIKNVIEQIPALVDRADMALNNGYLGEHGGLHGLFSENGQHMDDFAEALLQAAQLTLAGVLRDVQIDRAMRDSSLSAREIANWIQAQVEIATPLFNDCGGESHMMLGLPEKSATTALPQFIAKQHGQQPAVMAATMGDVVMAYEVDRIPVENVAFRLIESAPESCEYVPRLHTRNDIQWTYLAEPSAG
ncbi:MAG: protein kinase [Planctomycetales bacterium]|nr:protein kinase [Planctomycetales bacterium]